MRHLKLDNDTVTAILDELDAQHGESTSVARKLGQRFPYRVRGVRVDFQVSRDQLETHEVATHSIGRDSISFLANNAVHVGTPCRIHLIGIQSSTELAEAKVLRCKYIQGTACAHLVDCLFGSPVDPASFAATAIRARILLADASPMARRLLEHMLEPLNVEIAVVTDGISAVQRALSQAFDLVLMDTVLPKLDGLRAVEFLRKKGYLRPVCAVSTRTGLADRDACLAAGFEEFLPKPVKRERIEALVQRTRPQPLVSSLLHKPDMRPLIDEFVLDLLDRAAALEKAFGEDDRELLLSTAMTLKADAGGFGFEMITAAASEVEKALGDGIRSGELRPKLSRLVRLCQAARPATCDGAEVAAGRTLSNATGLSEELLLETSAMREPESADPLAEEARFIDRFEEK
jgi:CheY-like chemotaxis protein/HPt (histidine-containing phosphotransfer) domain-containing protein